MFLLEYGQKTFKNLTQMLGIRTQKWSRWGILLFLFILFLFARVEMCVLLCFHATDLVFVKHFVMLKWLDQYEKGIQCKIARMLGTSSRALFCKCLIWNYEISSLCSRKSRLVECTNNWYGSLCNIWVNVSFTYIFFPPLFDSVTITWNASETEYFPGAQLDQNVRKSIRFETS
jgi:hypothetical protein